MSKQEEHLEIIPENAILCASDGTWYFFYKYLDKDYTITFKKYGYYKKKEEAQTKYIHIVSAFKKQIDAIKNSINITFTFKSFMLYWLYEIQYPIVAPRRQVVLHHVVTNIILPSVSENVILSKVTSSYLDEIFIRCKSHSKTSGWMAQSVADCAFKVAIEDQYIKVNPMDGIIRYKRTIPKIDVIQYKDIPRFLEEARSFGTTSPTSDGVYLEILLALFCGLRKGEIMGLKFDDFDEEIQTVTISRQLCYQPEEVITDDGIKFKRKKAVLIKTKSEKSYRRLKIHRIIFEELIKRKRVIEKNMERCDYNHANDGFICLNQKGNFKQDNTLSAATKEIAQRAKITPVSLHDLRHTCASMLLEFGVEIEQISKMLGHKNQSTTLDIYCTTINGKQDIADFLDHEILLIPKDDVGGERR